MPDRCTFSELPVDQCAHCLGHTTPPQADPPRGWLHARHAGRCASCDEPFEAGALITWSGESAVAGIGGWVAECCAEARDAG